MTNPPHEPKRKIVPLPGEQKASPRPVTPPGKVHGRATAGMAVCAIAAIVATLLFITVGWGESGRYVVAIALVAALGFFLCASIAIFAAARDTYARSPRDRDSED